MNMILRVVLSIVSVIVFFVLWTIGGKLSTEGEWWILSLFLYVLGLFELIITWYYLHFKKFKNKGEKNNE